MLWLLSWTVYGLVVGIASKFLHPGDDPIGFLPTVGIGIAGSYVGGFINFLLGKGDPFSTSGLLMGVIGGVIFCWVYSRFHLSRFLEAQALKDEIKMLRTKLDEKE